MMLSYAKHVTMLVNLEGIVSLLLLWIDNDTFGKSISHCRHLIYHLNLTVAS